MRVILKWRLVEGAATKEEFLKKYPFVNRTRRQHCKYQPFHCKNWTRMTSSGLRCLFKVRWDQPSGRVWESGEHNHEPLAIKRWHFVANVDSKRAICRKYVVQRTFEEGHKNWFHCVVAMQMKYKMQRSKNNAKEAQKDKGAAAAAVEEGKEVKMNRLCPYTMLWNSETGELFESGQHSEHEMPKRIKVQNEWHLLEAESRKMEEDNSARAISRRFPVKLSGRKTGINLFHCRHCDGKKCFYRLRRKDGKIYTNNEAQCQPQQELLNDEDKEMLHPPEAEHTEIDFVEEVNRDSKCILPPVKREAPAADEELDIHSASVTICEEEAEECSSSACRQNFVRRVKKEEPSSAEVENMQKSVQQAQPVGSKTKVLPKPRKMLLRERKLPPNFYARMD